MSSDMILKVHIWRIKLGIYQIKVKIKLRCKVPKKELMPFWKNIPGKKHTKMLGAELSTITEYLMTGENQCGSLYLIIVFLKPNWFLICLHAQQKNCIRHNGLRILKQALTSHSVRNLSLTPLWEKDRVYSCCNLWARLTLIRYTHY